MSAAVVALVAIATLIFAIMQSRGKQFHKRAKNLMELRGLLVEMGPRTGGGASAAAAERHQELLDEMDAGARANAVLYAQSANRLARPGSFFTGSVLVAYGVLVGGLAVSVFLNPKTAGDWLGGLVFGVLSVGLLAFGIRSLRWRWATRKIRTASGIVDDTSREGLSAISNGVAARLRERRAARRIRIDHKALASPK